MRGFAMAAGVLALAACAGAPPVREAQAPAVLASAETPAPPAPPASPVACRMIPDVAISITSTRPLASAPSPEDLSRQFPARAQRTHTDGDATVRCRIYQAQGGGRLRDCSVVAEAPQDMDFGFAALRLSRGLRYAEAGADVDVTFAFRFTGASQEFCGDTPVNALSGD